MTSGIPLAVPGGGALVIGLMTVLGGTAGTGEMGGRFAVLFRERADEVTAVRELPAGGDF